MDTIDVRYNFRENCHELILVLNGEDVPGTFSFFDFIFSVENRLSIQELKTCSCGVSGCAGIWFGTRVKVRKHTVEWRDVDCRLPKRFYAFNKQDYLAAIQKTKDLIVNNIVGVPCDEYSFLMFETMEEFNRCLERGKYWASKDLERYYHAVPYFSGRILP
jgi:hypothetical protein